jgi:hypothetical protein
MTYELIKTGAGPIIKDGDSYISLSDITSLLSIAETYETFLEDLKMHIAEVLTESVQEFSDGFIHEIAAPVNIIQSYLMATTQYLMFKNQHWLPYLRALSEIR